MAHHNSTPQSVLDAPTLRGEWVSVQAPPGKGTKGKRGRIIPNAPYERTTPRRGRRVKRGGLE